MERRTEFHRIRECPSCETYWRDTGRRTVGFVDHHATDTTCPTCRAS